MAIRALSIALETKSGADIGKWGVYRYAEEDVPTMEIRTSRSVFFRSLDSANRFTVSTTRRLSSPTVDTTYISLESERYSKSRKRILPMLKLITPRKTAG